MITLNDNQKLAVETIEGPVLVVANPGSGKTRVVTERVKHILDKGFSPSQILAIAFTRAAATEMRHRLSEDLPWGVVRLMTITTFHGLAVRILRENGHRLGYRTNFSIYDERDQLDVLTQVLRDMNIKQPKAETVLDQLDALKFTDVKREYRDRVRGNNAMDFDMLIENALTLLGQQDVIDNYSFKFRFISVDEFQDVNNKQYTIAKLLSSHWNNLCAVGDPDQNIMTFQGSNIRHILDFTVDFPTAKIIYLDKCYRCPINILQSASKLIKNNRERLDKTITTDNAAGEVRVLAFENELEESLWIATKCKELYNLGVKFGSMAILARTHKLKNALLHDIKAAGVPINVCGRTEEFFKQPAVCQFLDYLKVIHNPFDAFSFRRIINSPNRDTNYIDILKSESFTRAGNFNCVEGARIYFTDQRHANQKIVELCETLAALAKDPAPTAVNAIGKMLMDHYTATNLVTRKAQIGEALHRYCTYDDTTTDPPIEEFLQYVGELDAQEDAHKVDPAAPVEDAVKIMTCHTAKGLEFPAIFIPGMEQGIFPISAANRDIDEMEQERRLFFVGITRAEQMLFVTRARQRQTWGKEEQREPSLFLEEFSLET